MLYIYIPYWYSKLCFSYIGCNPCVVYFPINTWLREFFFCIIFFTKMKATDQTAFRTRLANYIFCYLQPLHHTQFLICYDQRENFFPNIYTRSPAENLLTTMINCLFVLVYLTFIILSKNKCPIFRQENP